MTVKVTNNGFSTLSAGITDSATSLSVASGEGARFPNPSSPDVFYATLIDTSNNLEIVKVTARSTDSFTIVRAQDNTTARAFSTGDRIELRPVAKLFEDIQAEARDLNGAELVLDADGDTSITADTDDRIDIRVGGTDVAYISSNSGQGALINRKTTTPLIINGDMSISQRGTSTSSITNGNYRTLDRFYINNNGVGSVTNSQSTDVPTGQGFATSFKIAVDTSDTPSGTEWMTCQYRTEAQDLKPLKFNTSSAEGFTISFWVKSAKTGTYTLAILNDNASRSISQTYTISSANTWEKKVLSFAGDTAGAIPNNNTIGLILYWILASGGDRTSGTFQTSWDTYVTADFISSSQVNLGDSTSNDWYITGVQLEVGTFDANSIPPFQFEDAGTNLRRCQRYYQTIPGAKEGGANPDGTAVNRVYWDFKVSMRATPTITQGSGAAAAGVQFTNTEGYGIYRDGGNPPNIGSNAKADAEL